MSDFTVLCVNTFAAYIGVVPFLVILQIFCLKYKLPKRHQFGLYLYALAICLILMATHFMKRMCLSPKDTRRKNLSKWEVYLYFFIPWLVTFILTPFISNSLWNVIWNYALGMPV